MIGTFFRTKLGYPKNAKKWDAYVLFWDHEYNVLKNSLQLIVWDGLNGKGDELFDGTKLANAPIVRFDGFVGVLKKDLR